MPNKLDTLGVMAVLGNVIFEKEHILDIVRRLTMHEIPIVQYWTEQATAEARRENSRASILKVLEFRCIRMQRAIFSQRWTPLMTHKDLTNCCVPRPSQILWKTFNAY